MTGSIKSINGSFHDWDNLSASKPNSAFVRYYKGISIDSGLSSVVIISSELMISSSPVPHKLINTPKWDIKFYGDLEYLSNVFDKTKIANHLYNQFKEVQKIVDDFLKDMGLLCTKPLN